MSLTKEDLQAISDLIDVKLDEQDNKIKKRFDEQDEKFNNRFDLQEQKFNNRFDLQEEKFNKRFDLQDEKLDKKIVLQDEKFDKKLNSLKEEFKEILTDNNLLIAEHVQRVVQDSEERLLKEIKEIRSVTADNCYSIVSLKNKIS